jgi:hypothetical protein
LRDDVLLDRILEEGRWWEVDGEEKEGRTCAFDFSINVESWAFVVLGIGFGNNLLSVYP